MNKENYNQISSFENNQNKKRKRGNLPLIVFTIVLSVLVIVVAMIIFFGIKNKNSNEESSSVQTVSTTETIEEGGESQTLSSDSDVLDKTRKIVDPIDNTPDFSGQTAANLGQSLGKKYQKQVLWSTYTCKEADTLEKIALGNNISLSTLLSVNKIKNLDAVSVGTVLKIPDRDGSIYVVKKDDMLGTIVQKLNLSISWNDLQEINGLDDDKIKEGQELFIPDETSSANISTASRGLEFSSPMSNGIEKIIFNTRFTDPITKETAPLDGICLQASSGSKVYASCDGEVVDIEMNTGSRPNTVKVRHDGGYVTTYGYLATVEVGIGDSVTNETVLGTISKENSFFDNAMLFFQIEQNQVCLDPAAFF